MKTVLRIACWLVLAAMTWVTVTASLDRDVLTGFVEVWADPWGRATLFDAYFAFLAVWVWIAYREQSPRRSALWLVLLLMLGNFAIAGYFLLALHRMRPEDPWSELFRPARRPLPRPADLNGELPPVAELLSLPTRATGRPMIRKINNLCVVSDSGFAIEWTHRYFILYLERGHTLSVPVEDGTVEFPVKPLQWTTPPLYTISPRKAEEIAKNLEEGLRVMGSSAILRPQLVRATIRIPKLKPEWSLEHIDWDPFEPPRPRRA